MLMIGITRKGDFYLYSGDVNNIAKDKWLNTSDAKKLQFQQIEVITEL